MAHWQLRMGSILQLVTAMRFPDISDWIPLCAVTRINRSCLYSQATGDNVHEMGAAYQPSGEYKIMSGNLTMKVGDQANLTVYDEKVDVYSELEQSESKVLTKIENGEIIYRRRNPGNRTCAGMHFHP